jgi:4-amino-4-deoxy-L-arabinose transferase-like glycosyltransferase
MRSGLSGWVRRYILKPQTLYVLFSVLILLGLIHVLGTHPAGMNQQELATKNFSVTANDILKHPINAPHNLLAYGFQSAGLAWKTALRLSSAAFGLFFIFCLYSLLRSWFGKSVGALGAIIFAATPLFLVAARQGSAEIMFLAPVSLMAAYIWLLRDENKNLFMLTLLIICALSLYTPGMIWWLAGAFIISYKKLSDAAKDASPVVTAAALAIGLLILAPLGLAIAKDWTLIKDLALVPDKLAAPLTVLKNIGWMTLALFVKTPYHSVLILDRLPILNIIQIALMAFGSYALWSVAKSKLFILLLSILFSVAAAGINNQFSLLILGLPAIAVIVCAGLRYLYIEWRSVFPRNPVARAMALSLMAAVVVVHLLFGIRYAAIAWPNSVATKNTYVLK